MTEAVVRAVESLGFTCAPLDEAHPATGSCERLIPNAQCRELMNKWAVFEGAGKSEAELHASGVAGVVGDAQRELSSARSLAGGRTSVKVRVPWRGVFLDV